MGKIKIKENLFFLRRRRLVICVFSLLFLFFLAAWAFWYEPNSLAVKNYDLRIAGWNPAHNGLKIVAISDIHGGSNFITAEKIRRVVELINDQNPDLIVLLGDYVSEKRFNQKELKMPMSVIADNLAGLRAKHGVFAVMGNHDYDYNPPVVRAELERIGIRFLDEEAEAITPNGENLIVLGLPEIIRYNDWKKYSEDAKKALSKTQNKGSVLALVHNPDAIVMTTGDFLISENLRLVLAGHTHGGQVRLPFLGSLIVPSTYGQKYSLGLVMENGIDMFITSGVGTSILPVRFGVPPEISVLTIFEG
ncbi:MAG: metallophosphoesterase [Acidobacteriota bacterium]|nr:metallophosphoesterase [Acidobacteriota bacterium]